MTCCQPKHPTTTLAYCLAFSFAMCFFAEQVFYLSDHHCLIKKLMLGEK